jgi:hypothetical protein
MSHMRSLAMPPLHASSTNPPTNQVRRARRVQAQVRAPRRQPDVRRLRSGQELPGEHVGPPARRARQRHQDAGHVRQDEPGQAGHPGRPGLLLGCQGQEGGRSQVRVLARVKRERRGRAQRGASRGAASLARSHADSLRGRAQSGAIRGAASLARSLAR